MCSYVSYKAKLFSVYQRTCELRHFKKDKRRPRLSLPAAPPAKDKRVNKICENNARARWQDCAPPPQRCVRLEIDALTSNFPKDEPCTPRTVPHRANPFIRFESHLHLFFGSEQRRFNKINKTTASSTTTRPPPRTLHVRRAPRKRQTSQQNL